MHMEIEWDSEKATSNLQKHGVSFEEASTALLDPLALAQSARARLLTVIYTLRRPDRIRLISARKATRKEANYYA